MSAHIAPFPWYDVLLILALVALNGVLAMGELAIVSSREARLKAMAKSGNRGAECALGLAADPGRFLSTVQSGITLIAIFAGAFSGERLGQPTADRLQFLGLSPDAAHTAGFTLVIVMTTYVSLVIGEIVPKQIALRSPEPIAAVLARPLRWLSIVTAPFVWALNKSSELIFRLLGLNRESKNHVTAEELHLVVAEAQTAGVLEESERAIISGIVRLADRPVREVMTPRTEVDWIDVGASWKKSARRFSKPRTAAFRWPTGRSRTSSESSRPTTFSARCWRDGRSISASCAARPRSSPTSWMRWMRWPCCAAPTCRWRWSMTNMAISTGS